MENDRKFVESVWSTLRDHGVQTWVMGGWAEELWGHCDPRQHGDLDLLFPSETFESVDTFLRIIPAVNEIVQKRFSHKRAFEFHGVRVEVIIALPDGDGYQTSFFGGSSAIDWPLDTFLFSKSPSSTEIGVISPAALVAYRNNRKMIAAAYETHNRPRPFNMGGI